MARANNNKNFGINSRLRLYPVIIDEELNVARFGTKNEEFFEQLRVNANSTVYTVPSKYEYRPDLISFEQYGTPDLWWILVGFNRLFHPFKDFATGATIRIPDRNTISALLL